MNAPMTPELEHGGDTIGSAPNFTSGLQSSSSPLRVLFRIMRGRWVHWLVLSSFLGVVLAVAGYQKGSKIYESTAILRVYPKKQSVLYSTSNDSVQKNYSSFVKAETSFVAGHVVMSKALKILQNSFPDDTKASKVSDLAKSIDIKRSESLIVLKTTSKRPEFATAKLKAVTNAYLTLTAESKVRQQKARTETLEQRESDLLRQLKEVNKRFLKVGGEFGINAIAKAHIEKIAQIDIGAARQREIETTLASLRTNNGVSGADMNDQQILRATLLDRALADLNFERARLKADLSSRVQRYRESSPKVRIIREQIGVIEEEMDKRRNQIQVLGQTGALTDQSPDTETSSISRIEELLFKVDKRVEKLRAEARDLNERRVKLDYLANERREIGRMLQDTRKALDVIRIETNEALPGLVDLMSPATRPEGPKQDTSKLLAAAGLLSGGLIGTILVFLRGLTDKCIRWSDDLLSITQRTPILVGLSEKSMQDKAALQHAVNVLRNQIQLIPATAFIPESEGRVISTAGLATDGAENLALQLAESFSATAMSVLLIEGDAEGTIGEQLGLVDVAGWTEVLTGQQIETIQCGSLNILPYGTAGALSDSTVALRTVRKAITHYREKFEVIIVSAGKLEANLSTELILSCSDFAIGTLRRGDRRAVALRNSKILSERPSEGGGLWVQALKASDPILVQC